MSIVTQHIPRDKAKGSAVYLENMKPSTIIEPVIYVIHELSGEAVNFNNVSARRRASIVTVECIA